MEYMALVILAALTQYVYFTIRVGAAREKYGIDAPRTTGNETWERLFRIQQNTLEQLIIFIPTLVLFSIYVSATWALLPGVIFLIGRQLYAWEYAKNPKTRVPGMSLTLLANAALLVGAAIALVLKLV